MSRVPLLAIGGSAGSLQPLAALVRGLPRDLTAAVLIVVHTGDGHPSRLAQVLSRHGQLAVSWGTDDAPLAAGRIYVAPPGRHMLAVDGAVRLTTGPRVNRHRPSADVLFASVAQVARHAAVAAVLSGVLDDGAVGSALIARAGGQVLVQDPDEAEFSSMPRAALAATPGASKMRKEAATDDVLEALRHAEHIRIGAAEETELMEAVMVADDTGPGYLQPGETKLTRLACPECGGGLAQVDLPQITYFRCHVGHQYAPHSLAAAQAETSEQKLWGAVAALDEQAAMQRYLDEVGDQGSEGARTAQEVADRAAALRNQLREWIGEPAEIDDRPG